MPLKVIKLTRVYVDDSRTPNTVKKQPFHLMVDSIESYRTRTKITGQKTCIVTKSGMYVNIAESVQELERALNTL